MTNSFWQKKEVEPIHRVAFRPQEAAESLGISERTMSDWLKLEGFPVARIGGCRLIPIEDLKKWLSAQTANQPAAEEGNTRCGSILN